MIELRDVTKKYGDTVVLKDANLRIDNGEFVSIVGPSGSGKTTLLNVIAGLLSPTQGEVIVDGVFLYKLSFKERAVARRERFGFIFQTFNLISYLTVIENVEVPLYLAGAKKAEQRRIATELLENVGLGDKLNRLPTDLSVGEQQRVAIARALANNSAVHGVTTERSKHILLADEPTGNLDANTGSEIMKYIQQLNEEGGTILLVTHDSKMAEFADRNIEIIDGRLS